MCGIVKTADMRQYKTHVERVLLSFDEIILSIIDLKYYFCSPKTIKESANSFQIKKSLKKIKFSLKKVWLFKTLHYLCSPKFLG